jgi:hypothetical protein
MGDEEAAEEPRPEGSGAEEPHVQVDEDWKKAVAEEKERLRERAESESPKTASTQGAASAKMPAPTLASFMAGLYTQTLMALGDLENPFTKERETNAAEASFLIDTIAMLQRKMEGNLTEQEADYVQKLLTDLRMRYVNSTSSPEQSETQEPDEAGASEA